MAFINIEENRRIRDMARNGGVDTARACAPVKYPDGTCGHLKGEPCGHKCCWYCEKDKCASMCSVTDKLINGGSMAKETKKKAAGAVVAKQDFEARLADEVAAARTDGEAIGACKAFEHDITYKRLMKLAVIKKTLESKEYKAHGMTAEEFCESVGEKYRSTHDILEDLEPIMMAFSASFADFAGLKINKIRLLGQAVSANIAEIEDGQIVFEGEKFGPKELPEFLDRVEEVTHAKIKDGVEKKLDGAVNAKTRQLKSANDILLQENKSLHEIIPLDKLDASKSEKQLMLIEHLYSKFEAAVSYLAFEEMEIEDVNTAANVEGLLKRMHARLMHLGEKWESHKKGERL